MNEQLSKKSFIEKIIQARQEWVQMIAKVPREQMETAGVCGGWSLKDIIAHITWYESEMINMIKARVFAGSSYWELSIEERNALIYEKTKNFNLEQVQEQAFQVFSELIDPVKTLTDEALNNPARFPGMPLEWQPWHIMANNLYEHYADHLAQVKIYLEK